mmetsp:Transcript_12115/g.33566  ORF Transcript_12115/g.33566 Transcript_12115/m.33566 type:complete len:80 (-) Transcript_12115:1831-2070(-)
MKEKASAMITRMTCHPYQWVGSLYTEFCLVCPESGKQFLALHYNTLPQDPQAFLAPKYPPLTSPCTDLARNILPSVERT